MGDPVLDRLLLLGKGMVRTWRRGAADRVGTAALDEELEAARRGGGERTATRRPPGRPVAAPDEDERPTPPAEPPPTPDKPLKRTL